MWTYFKRSRISGSRGFTLIELMVVFLIMMLITMFIVFRQQGFNSSTLLRSLAYSVALSVRQAQVYGVSVRESAVGSNTYGQGYGAFFGNVFGADDNHYFLFSDNDGNGQYASGEELPRYTIGNGRTTAKDYAIKNLCAHVVGGSDQCSCTLSTQCTVTSPTITWLMTYFRRPNPDGCFATSQSINACTLGATPAYRYDYAYVQLKMTGGVDVRTVKVTNTGQIVVCKLNVVDVSTC